jgi:anthranilate phosphoribosyltransferase
MIKDAINTLVSGRSLSTETAALVMAEIMDGNVTPAQFGAFVTALRLKGETVEEIVGMAKTMRAKAIPVITDEPVVDTCGTGGDNSVTFNISTTAAFVVAGAGVKVAKHGNRAMSSQCGSADVLEALGIKIDLNAEQVKQCLKEVGICFMFAPVFHPAMKYASAPRREIGIRTVFNILGPLANPAGAEYQVIGVPSKELGEKIASALCNLGIKHALVVHAQNGMDELSITGRSLVWEIGEDILSLCSYYLSPDDFGFKRAKASSIKGGTPIENAAILRQVLSGEKSPRRDVVVMNAAAAIATRELEIQGTSHTGGIQALVAGARLAEEAINSGRALGKLERLIEFSQSFTKKA